MLDDVNVLKQRDPNGALEIASSQYKQEEYKVDIQNKDHDDRPIASVLVAGMGGSALASLLVKSWLKSEMTVPMDVIRSYDIPAYVNSNTLVILAIPRKALIAFIKPRKKVHSWR